ncbi:MAG TPA: MFS transporter [Chloroflexota bacterium]|nr:MFS transporter [Chloroflexota bacterium]
MASLCNNVGTWMQITATGWLVLQISNSASSLGITVALQGLPVLVFALMGGVFADRLDRYRLVVAAQVGVLIPDVVLAILVATNHVRVEHLYIYSLLTGFLSAVSSPARRALLPHLVSKDALLSAMALDGTLWNGAAIVGPSLAGILIATWGLGSPFYVNVVSDIVGVAFLLMIRARAPKIVQSTSAWKNVGEGLRYAWTTPSVRWLLLVTASVALLGRSYFPLAPIFARDVFHAGPEGLGLISTVPAIGTVAGSVCLAFFATSVNRRLLLLAASVTAFFLAGYALAPVLLAALPFLFLVGASGFAAQTMASTLLQQTVDEHMRGRVMSQFTACTVAAWRLAALPYGLLAQQWGAPVAATTGAAMLFLVLLPSLRTVGFGRRAVVAVNA